MHCTLSAEAYVARSRIDVLLGCGSTHQLDHGAGGKLARFLNIDGGHLFAPLRLERRGALARLCHVRARAELLNIACECRSGASLLRVGPGLLVRFLACLLIERSKPLARLGRVRARTEVLRVCSECRCGTGAHRVCPSLIVRLFAT